MEDAQFTLKVRMLKAEVMETLLYGCVTWTLGQEHFAELRTAHHNLLLRIIGCLLYTSPSPRDGLLSRMPSSA